MISLDVILKELNTVFSSQFEIKRSLDNGASLRKYWLLNDENKNIFVLSYQGNVISKYLSTYGILIDHGLPVPKLLWHHLEYKMILTEYADNKIFNTIWVKQPPSINEKVIQIMKKYRDIEESYFTVSFYPDIFDIEWHELIIPFVLNPKQLDWWSGSILPLLKDCFGGDQVPSHRDLQSSNILVNGDELVLIDFQDSMLINPYYDICSLCWDSYVEMSFEKRTEISRRMSQNLSGRFDQKTYFLVSLQRKLHDIGAFVRASDNGFEHFNTFIQPATLMCEYFIDKIGVSQPEEGLWKQTKISKYLS